MNDVIRFLHNLAQSLASMGLYSPGHPAVTSAVGRCHDSMLDVLSTEPRPVFLFLGQGAPVYGGRAVHEMISWPWTDRLAGIGVQRLEFDSGVTVDSLTEFLAEINLRVAEPVSDSEIVELTELAGIRFGTVAVVDPFDASDAAADAAGNEEHPPPDSREQALDLSDELAAMSHVLEVARQGKLARAEADTIVRVLETHLVKHSLPQAAPSPDPRTYLEYHGINTALLVMAAASSAGVMQSDRHRLGLAALLHDIGMTQLPRKVLLAESLTDEQRTIMETHTAKGASLLLREGGATMDLAAVVAYEHHLRPDGGGYPSRVFSATAQWASRLVGTCAAYVALRAPRPYRASWSPARVVGYLREGAGTVFDEEAARSVIHLVELKSIR